MVVLSQNYAVGPPYNVISHANVHARISHKFTGNDDLNRTVMSSRREIVSEGAQVKCSYCLHWYWYRMKCFLLK